MLIDSHAHLNMLAANEDLDQVLARAKAANVDYIQTICTKLGELPELIEITDKYSNIFASVGVHPGNVDKESLVTSGELIELLKHPKIISLGETGLDYFYHKEQKDLQIASFVEHIIASQETHLPVIVHTRDADDDTASIVREFKLEKNFKGLIHCFTASREFAKKMLDLDFYISFSGIITFKNAGHLRDVVKFIPIEKILIETDSPYLAPSPMRGKTNEPSYVSYIAREIASIKSLAHDEVAHATSKNFFKLFAKAKSS